MSSPATPADTAKESRGTTTDPHKCRSGRERDDVGQATSMRPPYAYTVTRKGGQKRGNNHRYKRSMERRSGHGTHGRYRRGRAVRRRYPASSCPEGPVSAGHAGARRPGTPASRSGTRPGRTALCQCCGHRAHSGPLRTGYGTSGWRPRPRGLRSVTRLWAGLSRLGRQAQERSQVRARSRAVLPAERALLVFIAGRDTEVARGVEGARRIIKGIEAMAHSAALANAIAERAVIKTLSTLPDDFVLINDLHLSTDQDIPFEDSYLKTVQLDHLLVGPTGVYAIETRNWSSTVAADGDEADPVLQVTRASFLCSRILKDAGSDQIVRSVVACGGAPPTRSGGAHVAVMPTARLLAYVQYGLSLVSVQEIADVCRILNQTR